MPERVVVCNTSPLLYLHQVGQLELLKSLYQRIKIPSAVREELRGSCRKLLQFSKLFKVRPCIYLAI